MLLYHALVARGAQNRRRCACDPHQSFWYDLAGYGCQKEYDAVTGKNSTEAITSYNMEMGLSNLTEWRVLDIPHG